MSQSSKLRPLPWFTALVLALLASVQGCDCGSTGVDTRRFACNEDDDCASGFVCRLGECQPEDDPVEPDGGVDSGVPDAGRPDGGGTDGGPDAGTPDGGTSNEATQLSFTSAPQTVVAGQCSGEVVVETQDAMGNTVVAGSRTTIALLAAPSTDFGFYSDPACSSPVVILTLQASRSRTTFYFRGRVAQPVRITAAASGLLPALQTETITPAPPAGVAFVTPSQTLPAGGCSAAVELETRDAYDNPSPVSTQTQVGLGAQDGSELSFFNDPACTTAATEAEFSPGTARALFYFKGRTGGTFSLSTSSETFSTVSQSETILPVVRTGTCILQAGTNLVTCPISPPQLDMTKTLLLFQASTDEDSPDSALLRCSLSAVDTITCRRNDGDDPDDPAIQIQWQTAELASGLTVQHLQASCGNAPTTELPIQPVSSLQEAFLLVSSEQDGSALGDDDFYTASLYQGDEGYHVDLEFSVDCQSTWLASVQVVELEGANVTRGITGSMAGTQLVVSNLPAVDPASTALLFTYRTTGTDPTASICDRVLRGELTSPTSITFSRGAGSPACADASIDTISWERIEFGARASAQHLQVTMGANTQTVSVPITKVDPTRTLVFASGQMLSGQAGGEISLGAGDEIGASLGWYTLTSSTALEVTRGVPDGSAQWTSTVLQLEP